MRRPRVYHGGNGIVSLRLAGLGERADGCFDTIRRRLAVAGAQPYCLWEERRSSYAPVVRSARHTRSGVKGRLRMRTPVAS